MDWKEREHPKDKKKSMYDCRLLAIFKDGWGKGDEVSIKKVFQKSAWPPVGTELSAFAVYSCAGILWMKLFQTKPEFLVLGLECNFSGTKTRSFLRVSMNSLLLRTNCTSDFFFSFIVLCKKISSGRFCWPSAEQMHVYNCSLIKY